MSLQERKRRGTKICRKVYAQKYETPRSSMQKLHPDLTGWMIEDGYGKVLSRNGLSLRERELISVAALAALGWGRQLRSHVIGSLNVGSERREVLALLRSIQSLLSDARYNQALGALNLAFTQKNLDF